MEVGERPLFRARRPNIGEADVVTVSLPNVLDEERVRKSVIDKGFHTVENVTIGAAPIVVNETSGFFRDERRRDFVETGRVFASAVKRSKFASSKG